MSMTITIRRDAALGLFAATLVALSACDNAPRLPSEPAATAPIEVGLSLSSWSAAVGQRVVVSIDLAKTTANLGGVQGELRFDPSRLEYVGEQVDAQSVVAVNDAAASSGLLRVASLDANGLKSRTALLAFTVRAAGYDAGLRYEFDKAATNGVVQSIASAKVRGGITIDPSLSIAEPRRMALQDWLQESARRLGKSGSKPVLRPGQYRPGWIYGDATLDGLADLTDAVFMINAAVNVNGTEILLGTAEPTNRDAALAGNVVPYNTNAEISPGVPNPQFGKPGTEQNGTKLADVADAVGIINHAVFANQPVVGTSISGTRGDSLAGCGVVHSQDVNNGYIHTETWNANVVHCLDGIIRVDSGQTLTIEPGTVIKGQNNRGSAMFIQRDGRIIADGTETRPITFSCTAATPFKGCWGGLVVLGWAPVSRGTLTSPGSLTGRDGATGCREQLGEGGAPIYGGCNPNDNSGILRYVRIMYGGFILSANNELNGLTLYGVGRGTTVDHVQIHGGLDDGLEFFGGTVNVKYVYLSANSDDDFDITDGWNGSAQFVMIQKDSTDGDKGLEADNQGTPGGDFTAGADNSATQPPGLTNPYTRPQLWNFTYVGKRAQTTCGGPAAANCVNDALHIRRGTAPELRNWLVYSAPVGLNIDDAATCSNVPRFSIRNSIFARNTALGNVDADAVGTGCGVATSGTTLEEQYLATEAATVSVIPPGVAADTLMQGPFEVRTPDFRPRASALVNGAAAALPVGNTFLTLVNYIGAVEPANSAKTNIPWYATWTVGWRTATAP